MKNSSFVLHNAHVLCMDEGFSQFEPGAVVVEGDSIVDVGPEAEVLARHQNLKKVNCGGRVLMPGFVNAHTHVPMTLLRGLSDDLRLDVWLLGYIMPVEREFVSEDFVKLGTELACAELIRSGCTTFADMYYFEESIAEATAQVGMRALLGESVLKFPTPDAESFEDALSQCREFIRRWKNHPLIVPCVAPHAPYTCTDEILQACADLARDFDVPVQMHLAETAFEVENMRKEKGMPVIPYIKKHGLLDTKLLGAHCVHIDEGEMRAMKQHGAGIAHNPTSNLKLGSGVAPVTKMLECGINVGIGTDGPASNNDLDMFEEIRLAALLAKGITGDPTVIPARTALLMATRMGAASLHMDKITGSIEIGKRADLITIDTKTLHNLPRFRRDSNNIYSQIVYAAKSTDVHDVMVNGHWLMQNRELRTIKESELLERAARFSEKVDAFLMPREKSVLTKLIAIGTAVEGEHYEVQAKGRVTDVAAAVKKIASIGLEIERKRHYREFDTYMMFSDEEQGYVRYREDEFIGEDGTMTQARYRLTHVGPKQEEGVGGGVVLSQSRFIASAQHSLRFYREYFRPSQELTIEKDRQRWLVKYKGTGFFINCDTVTQPKLGSFVEVKSRTWSRSDAEQKGELAKELLHKLGVSEDSLEHRDYFEIAKS
jgi:5-methylthioadenosine/S-adenosylhomocysteine deaminase